MSRIPGVPQSLTQFLELHDVDRRERSVAAGMALRVPRPGVSGGLEALEALRMHGTRQPRDLDACSGTGAPPRAGRLYLWLWLGYFIFVVYGSLVPCEFRGVPWADAWRSFLSLPYRHLGIASRSDLVANVLLFIPLTFFAMGALTRENTRRHRWAAALLVLLGAAVLSAAIEFVQVYFPPRTQSLNDVVAEAAGSVAGIAAWFLWGGAVSRWARSLLAEHDPYRLAVRVLAAYVVVLTIYQLLPFDLTISPGELYQKWKEGKVCLSPFSDLGALSLYQWVSDMAQVAPVGFLAAILVRNRRHALLKAVGAGFVFVCGIEFLQLLVYSRYSSSADVIIGGTGAALGVLAARCCGPMARRSVFETGFWRRHGRWLSAAVTAAWFAALAWTKWEPFDFRWPEAGLGARLRGMLHVPLYYQYFLSEFHASAQVVTEFVTMFILGMMLRGVLGVSRRGRAVAVIVAVAAGAALEGGQVFVAQRTPDATSMGIAALGGAAGALVFPWFQRTFLRTAADAHRNTGVEPPGHAARGSRRKEV